MTLPANPRGGRWGQPVRTALLPGFRLVCQGVYYSVERYRPTITREAVYRLAIRGRTGMWWLSLERASALRTDTGLQPVAKVGPFAAVRLAKRAANDLLTSHGL